MVVRVRRTNRLAGQRVQMDLVVGMVALPASSPFIEIGLGGPQAEPMSHYMTVN